MKEQLPVPNWQWDRHHFHNGAAGEGGTSIWQAKSARDYTASLSSDHASVSVCTRLSRRWRRFMRSWARRSGCGMAGFETRRSPRPEPAPLPPAQVPLYANHSFQQLRLSRTHALPTVLVRLTPCRRLRLHPMPSASGGVGRCSSLRNNAFEAVFHAGVHEGLPVIERRHQADAGQFARAQQQHLKLGEPLLQRGAAGDPCRRATGYRRPSG